MLRSILLIILLLLSSCGRFGGIDIDREHQLEARKIHEECFQLERGDVVHLGFDSSAPLDFNVHRHEVVTSKPVCRDWKVAFVVV